MRSYLRFFLALAFAAGLLIFPAEALEASRTAIALWALSVAPALFPFLAVLPFLTGAEARGVYARAFGWLTRFAFALPGSAASALVVGLVSGSPAGAMAVARVARSERLTTGQASRMAGIACGLGPIYVVSGMGVALAGSAQIGWRLALSQLAALLCTGVLFRWAWRASDQVPSVDSDAAQADFGVSRAVLSILKVGGYMTVFAAGIAIAAALFGAWFSHASLAIDLPTGAAHAQASGIHRAWVAAALGFGGMCIAAQNMSALRAVGVTWGKYLVQKLATAVFCAGFYLAQESLAPSGWLAWSPHGAEFEAATAGIAALMLPVAGALLLAFFGKRAKIGDS
ncbi:MAG: hypothetical protein ACOYI5_04690 [Christensenellales bacterium]|jgi:hypothetical protein